MALDPTTPHPPERARIAQPAGPHRAWLHPLDYLGQVSGLQCTLRLEESPGQRVLVTDSSTNGTFVNGEEVARGETRELPIGAVMTILVGSIDERDAEFERDEIPCFRVEMRQERYLPCISPVSPLLPSRDAPGARS